METRLELSCLLRVKRAVLCRRANRRKEMPLCVVLQLAAADVADRPSHSLKHAAACTGVLSLIAWVASQSSFWDAWEQCYL